MIGAPLYVRSIERDLERRVPDRLAESGFSGLTASFSGQDGTIHCPSPLRDPQRAIDLVYDVDGVRTIDLDRSCRVSDGDTAATGTTAPDERLPASDPTVATTADTATTDPATTVAGDPSATTLAGFDTVGELVRTSPRLSILSSLIGEADLSELFDGDGPITVFAPDNDALEELAADVLAELRTRPDLLAEVLRHHVVDGRVGVDELREGELVTQHGGDGLDVVRSGAGVTVGGAAIIDGDLGAANGTVHVVDRMLLPGDLELRSLGQVADAVDFVATLRTGRLDLSGVVVDGAVLDSLVAAAATSIDPANVTHDLEVDPDGLDADTAAAVGELLAVAPVVLASGSVAVDGTAVSVRGTVIDRSSAEVLAEVAARAGATVDVVERPVADDEAAAAIEAEMNAVVSGSPLEFAPGSDELVAATAPTLDVIAALAKQVAGVQIVVEGHTDSDGTSASNLALSDRRAEAVLVQLAARGVPLAQLEHRGVGDAEPVLVDGVEDKAASRRVEFTVTAPPTP